MRKRLLVPELAGALVGGGVWLAATRASEATAAAARLVRPPSGVLGAWDGDALAHATPTGRGPIHAFTRAD